MTRIIQLPVADTVTANDFVPVFQDNKTKRVSATTLSGPPGPAATVQVGTTTTGAPGTSAAVNNSGTTSAAVLNFIIPAGAKGDPGNTGAPGTAATVSVGTTTTGAPGTNASVTNSGTSSAATFNFTVPRGATGIQGPPGAAGAASRYYSQEDPPTDSRLVGDVWFDTSTGTKYEWVVDTDGGQWVDMTGFSAGPNLTTNDIEITDFTKGLILRSSDGSRWRITVDNAGVLIRTKL